MRSIGGKGALKRKKTAYVYTHLPSPWCRHLYRIFSANMMRLRLRAAFQRLIHFSRPPKRIQIHILQPQPLSLPLLVFLRLPFLASHGEDPGGTETLRQLALSLFSLLWQVPCLPWPPPTLAFPSVRKYSLLFLFFAETFLKIIRIFLV